MKGSSLDTNLFHFAGAPLQQFNDTVLKGNQGCSPHSPADYMSISSMVSSMQKSLSWNVMQQTVSPALYTGTSSAADEVFKVNVSHCTAGHHARAPCPLHTPATVILHEPA